MKNLGSGSGGTYSVYMAVVQDILQILFVILMLGIIGLFALNLMLSWAWAQNQSSDLKTSHGLRDILSIASVETIAQIILGIGHFRKPKVFLDAPPLDSVASHFVRKQLPVIFIPSLHTGAGLFSVMIWRLKRHNYSSLWPFAWKPFLKDHELLEDQLADYLRQVLIRTRGTRFRIVSFGSSRRVISHVLQMPEFKEACEKWIAFAAPSKASATMKFMLTARIRSSYIEDESILTKHPHALLVGTHDIYCYPKEVFGEDNIEFVEPVGHYSLMIHPSVTQKAIEELATSQ